MGIGLRKGMNRKMNSNYGCNGKKLHRDFWSTLHSCHEDVRNAQCGAW
jgi:hypothetical protein